MSVIIVARRRCSPGCHPRIDSTRGQPIGRISPPSDETLCVYCHFLVECFCVRRPPKKKVPTGSWRWHTPQRDYSALVYLNDNFTGGELVFPDVDVVIIPRAGLLVAFPSNHKCVHAVPKILSEKRYSIPVWFTVKSAKATQF